MPFISSSRSTYGPQGKKNSQAAKGKLIAALATTDKTFAAGTIKIVDLSGTFSNAGNITVYAKGGNGGSNSAAGGYGALIQGTVPYSLLAGKRIAFVSGSNGQDGSGGRGSAGGGGYSGIVILGSGYETLQHICSAAGGGGASGGGDSGTAQSGQSTSSISYSGTPAAGSGGVAKSSNGSTGSYPTLNLAGRPGSKFGGGNAPGIDVQGDGGINGFLSGGGGGFGPLAGGDPSDALSPGARNGEPIVSSGNGVYFGGVGGGGASSGGGSGSVTWRVTSGGGGGGGFVGGAGGSYSGDAQPRPGFAGTSYWHNSAAVQSSSFANSSTPYLRVVLG